MRKHDAARPGIGGVGSGSAPVGIAILVIGLTGLVALALGPPGAEPGATATALLAGAGLVLIGLGLRLLHRRQQRLLASLADAAMTDPLTGLLNRRALQARMEQELSRSRREGTALSLVVADLDDFKELNDGLGHLGGDMALERTAGVITGSLRASDTAARLGGDEFALILPGAGPHAALRVCDRLRSRLESAFETTAAAMTISLGIAGFPEHGLSTEQLLGAADRAMYAAKALGKNRTMIHGPAVDELLGDRVPRPTPDEVEAAGSLSG